MTATYFGAILMAGAYLGVSVLYVGAHEKPGHQLRP